MRTKIRKLHAGARMFLLQWNGTALNKCPQPLFAQMDFVRNRSCLIFSPPIVNNILIIIIIISLHLHNILHLQSIL